MIIILDTLTAFTAPVLNLFSPITDVLLGPSPPSTPLIRLEPMFSPTKPCLTAIEFTPFTVVLNKNALQPSGRTISNIGKACLLDIEVLKSRLKNIISNF